MIKQISDQEYFSNPALSASIAKILLSKSPLHAKWAYDHPEDCSNTAMDIGTISHDLVLRGINSAEVLDFPDWRTKASKEARELAREAGKTPILASKFAQIEAMAKALKDHFGNDYPFSNGRPEVSIFWDEMGQKCKGKIDWLRDDNLLIVDYKTTTDANPSAFGRKIFSDGYDIQSAFYLRGLEQITGKKAKFVFVVQEVEPPFAVSTIEIDKRSLNIAERKALYAVETWKKCCDDGAFPSYQHHSAEIPAYLENDWKYKEFLISEGEL